MFLVNPNVRFNHEIPNLISAWNSLKLL